MRAIRFTLAIPPLVWGGIVNLFLIGNLIASGARPIVLMNIIAPWITLCSLSGFTLALILRAPRRLLIWLVPGVIAFGWWYGAAWLPKPPPDSTGVEFTVMTYNIKGYASDPEQMSAVIRDANADIVALEEVQDKSLEYLTGLYPYQATTDSGNSVAMFSRFPILETDFPPIGEYEGRHLRAVIDISGQPVVVYVIHPPHIQNSNIEHSYDVLHYYNEHLLQPHIVFTVDQIQNETLPVLMLCDCNTTPRSREYDLLDGVLDEAFGARGWGFGFTYPVKPLPIIRIDYVWYSQDFAALDAEAWPDAGTSDHHPVWARLALR